MVYEAYFLRNERHTQRSKRLIYLLHDEGKRCIGKNINPYDLVSIQSVVIACISIADSELDACQPLVL